MKLDFWFLHLSEYFNGLLNKPFLAYKKPWMQENVPKIIVQSSLKSHPLWVTQYMNECPAQKWLVWSSFLSRANIKNSRIKNINPSNLQFSGCKSGPANYRHGQCKGGGQEDRKWKGVCLFLKKKVFRKKYPHLLM